MGHSDPPGIDGLIGEILFEKSPKVWQEGATATVAGLDRRGKRLGTVYLGHMPESSQGTLTAQ